MAIKTKLFDDSLHTVLLLQRRKLTIVFSNTIHVDYNGNLYARLEMTLSQCWQAICYTDGTCWLTEGVQVSGISALLIDHCVNTKVSNVAALYSVLTWCSRFRNSIILPKNTSSASSVPPPPG